MQHVYDNMFEYADLVDELHITYVTPKKDAILELMVALRKPKYSHCVPAMSVAFSASMVLTSCIYTQIEATYNNSLYRNYGLIHVRQIDNPMVCHFLRNLYYRIPTHACEDIEEVLTMQITRPAGRTRDFDTDLDKMLRRKVMPRSPMYALYMHYFKKLNLTNNLENHYRITCFIIAKMLNM